MPAGFVLAEKRLIRRYLIWCYKTTKEELERTDRKFTQLEVDQFILDALPKISPEIQGATREQYLREIGKFEEYKNKKQEEALTQKFFDQTKKIPHVHYLYLKNRLRAVEKTIDYFLGKRELKRIELLYEEEMTQRILQAREHH